MKDKQKIKALFNCLKKNKEVVLFMFLVSGMNLCIFFLYGLNIEPFIYSLFMSVFILFVFLIVDYFKQLKLLKEWDVAMKAAPADLSLIPKAQGMFDDNYQELICKINELLCENSIQYKQERQDMLDYYTVWVHQIKTPIAVLKLMLSEKGDNQEFLTQLFRIEQYVDMVLQYIRLGSDTNDLLIREYSLDDMIREIIRKYAPQFVGKKIKLIYEPTAVKIVTDRKWFSCILEQFISNAIKYTPSYKPQKNDCPIDINSCEMTNEECETNEEYEKNDEQNPCEEDISMTENPSGGIINSMGVIKIIVNDNGVTIKDNGIGISPEDLPRIFEKGYTGLNGRAGQKSSGLGLYLAKRAAKLIEVGLSVQSKVGEGSCFCIEFGRKKGL